MIPSPSLTKRQRAIKAQAELDARIARANGAGFDDGVLSEQRRQKTANQRANVAEFGNIVGRMQALGMPAHSGIIGMHAGMHFVISFAMLQEVVAHIQRIENRFQWDMQEVK